MDLLHLCRVAAEAAAEYIRGVERPAGTDGWGRKDARDFVTDVDRTAERIIRDIVLAADPESRVVGEELNPEVRTDGIVWIVDPLDGTANFLHGYPWYAVSVAAAIDGVLEAGVVVHVPRNEVYFASRGGGAWLGARRLAVSPITEPEFALVGTGYPFKDLSGLDEYQRQFALVAGATSGMRRAGSAALDLVSVASGEFEVFWEQNLSAWDLAAGSLLVREAGGVVTNFGGRQVGVEHSSVVAGNVAMHAWMLRAFRNA